MAKNTGSGSDLDLLQRFPRFLLRHYAVLLRLPGPSQRVILIEGLLDDFLLGGPGPLTPVVITVRVHYRSFTNDFST